MTAGYLVFQATRRQFPADRYKIAGKIPLLLAYSIGISLLPDVDAIFGILAGDFGRFHNNGTHSLVLGSAIALVIAGAIWIKRRSGFVSWFTLTFLSYGSHVVLDFFTYGGRGVMLLWPFSAQRFESSLKLFYGVRWSEGFLAVEHLWTLATELLFVVLAISLFQLAWWKRVGKRAGRVVTNSEGR